MSKVICGLSVSVDGYITGREPGPGRGLGDGGALFDWYFDGDVPSEQFDGFKLSQPSQRVFDALAGRVGATVAGRRTYDDSSRFGDDGARTRPRRCSSSATGRRPRWAAASGWSRPASPTRSRPPARPPAARTSA